MLIPTAFIADKSKKKKVTPVSKEEQAKAFDILKRQTEKEKAIEDKKASEEINKFFLQRELNQNLPVATQVKTEFPEVQPPASEFQKKTVAPTVKTTSEGLVKKTFNTKYGVVDYVADERESKIFKGTDVNAINNLTKDIVQYFEGLGRDQGRKPIVKNTREKYTFDEVNAALNPNFVEEETRKGVKQFEDATLGKLDVLGVRARLNELADYAKQSDSTLGQVAGGFVEAVANPMTTFAMSTGNIVDPNATLEERGGAALNLALAAIPIGQFAGAATAGASAFKQGLSSGLRNAIKVGAREYAKDTLFGNLALREITLDSVVRQLRDAGEVEGNVLRFKNDLRREAKRSGVNPSDYLKNKFQEAEVAVEPSIPSPTQATLGQLVDETIPDQPGGAELNLLRTAETGKPTYTAKAGARVVDETGNPVIDEALKTADEITNQAPTTGNSAIDEAFKVEQEIAEQATPPTQEPVIDINPTTRERYNAIADEDDAWLEQYYARKMNTRQAGFELEDYEAMARMARSFAIKYGYNNFDDALQLVARTLRERTGIDIAFTNADRQAIKDSIDRLEGKSTVTTEPPVSSAMQAEQPPVPPTQTATTAIPEADTQQFSGISNRAFDESEIAGRLESAPGANGKSAKEIYERNRNRDDYLLLADRIANKEIGITADNIAAIHAGGTKLERNVEDAIQAVKDAISRGASEQEIAQLVANRDNARKIFKEYADKVQKGKSEWSDIGRVIALRTELDTGNITRVLDELETIKGKTLTDDEIKKWTDIVEKHKAENEKLRKQIENLQTKNANVTPDVIKADAQVQAIKKSAPKVRPKQTPDSKQKLQNALDNAISKLDSIVRPQTLETLGANLEPKFFENFMSDPATQSYFQGLANAQLDVSKVINNLLETEAIEDYGTLLTRLQEEGLNITDTDLKLILSGEYPKPIKLIDPSDIEKEYLKVVRSQLQKESKASSVAERSRLIKKIQRINEDIRTNVKPGERAKPTTFKENEDLRKRLDDLKKQYNEKNQDEILRIQLKQRNEREAIKSQLEAERPKELAEKLENIAVQIKLANPIPRIADYLSNQLVKVDKTVSDAAFNKMVGAGFERLTGQQAVENFARGERKVRIDRVKERAKIRAKANLELIKDGISELGTEKFGGKGIGTQAAALTDLPFKAYWEEYGIDVFADDKARKLLKKDNISLTKENIAKKRDEIINNLDEHPDVEINAQNYALNKTFNNDNWASSLQNFATRNASKGQKFLLNEALFRFSKVITNVGIDALDRTGYGVLRGIQKAIKGKGNLSPAESLIITDMIKKGLTGVALQTLGYYLGDKISAEIKGDRLKYVDFGLLNRVGGVLSPFLLGVSLRKTLDSDIDENSKKNLYLSTGIKMVSNNPLASNLRDILELTNSSTPSTVLPEYVGKKTSNVLIPGIVRDSATQIDEIANADAQRKKYEKDAGAFDIVKGEFQSKIPFWRQQLPLKNQKVGRPDE
jgi:hypothetical protein